MQNHWNRPGWTEGRRSYHWMLSFHDAAEVRQLAATCQARLGRSELDLVPLDALHLTIGRVAFTDELDHAEVEGLGKAAQAVCTDMGAFDLLIGPLAGSRGALRFSVAPWTELLELHRRLSKSTRDQVGNADRMNTDLFRPHLSIAYSNQDIVVADLLVVVGELRRHAPVSAKITAASLVELRREGRAYRYDEVASVRLA